MSGGRELIDRYFELLNNYLKVKTENKRIESDIKKRTHELISKRYIINEYFESRIHEREEFYRVINSALELAIINADSNMVDILSVTINELKKTKLI